VFKSIACALGATLLAATAASAATATADLNLRAGPGTSYAVIGAIPANGEVAVLSCTDDQWCMVDAGGVQGWAFGGNLDNGGAAVTLGSAAPIITAPAATATVIAPPAAVVVVPSGPSSNAYRVFPNDSSKGSF
jgi:uncharacterized protein YraI